MIVFSVFEKISIPEKIASQVEEIYLTSFPAPEREPYKNILEGIRTGSTLLACLFQYNKVAGMAIINPLNRTGLYLLGYLAIAKAKQSQGLGSYFLSALKQELIQRAVEGLILEVDNPSVAVSPAEREMRLRRIRFYERNGGVLLNDGEAYREPVIKTGEHPGNAPALDSLSMRLMWISFMGNPGEGFLMPMEDLFLLIYQQIYGRAAGDPLVKAVLADLTQSWRVKPVHQPFIST